MAGLRAFIQHFFRCDECRTNFLRRLADPSAAELVTRYDAVIWMWETHNRVNARIAKVSASAFVVADWSAFNVLHKQ